VKGDPVTPKCPGSGQPTLERRTDAVPMTVPDPRPNARPERPAVAAYAQGICPVCGAQRTVDAEGRMRSHFERPGPVGKLRAVEHVTRDGRFVFGEHLATGRWQVMAADPRDDRFVPAGSHPTLRLAVLALEQRIAAVMREHREAS
jgi:hypothetical protein